MVFLLDMYRVDNLELANTKEDEDGSPVPQPDRIQLSAEHVAMNGAYVQDTGDRLILFLGKVLQSFFCEKMFGVSRPIDVDENLTDLPELENEDSERWEDQSGFIENNSILQVTSLHSTFKQLQTLPC